MNKFYVLSVVFVFTLLVSCNRKNEAKEEATKYVVTSPIIMDTTYVKQYVAQIRSFRNIEIRAQEKGYLDAILVDEGRYVKTGQLLFRIMPKIYEAELQKAEAEARAAEIELENTKALVAKNVVSKNEQLMAQAKLDEAKAELALAKTHLSFTEIRAPFDGVLDRIPKKLGSLIDEGELLTTLSDNSKMFAYFNVAEPEYLEYQTNVKNRGSSNVGLLLANFTELSAKGKIETIEGEFDNETGNIAFRAIYPNPNGLLKNGQTGKVLMTFPYRNAMIIPQKATYEIQDKTYVYLLGKDNTVHSRQVTILSRLSDLYIIGSGLTVEDKILLEGLQKVKEDEKIQYDFIKPAEAISHLRLKAE